MEQINDILGRLQRERNSAPPSESPPSQSQPERLSDPECPECAGIGWLRGEGRALPCSCTMATWEATRRDRLIAWAGITAPEAGRTFDALRESPAWTAAQRRTWRGARDTAREYAEGRSAHKWLALFGTPGGGKTHLALAVLNWRIGHPGSGPPGRYIVAPSYLSELRARMDRREDGAETMGELRQRYIECPLLILDDLGTEHMTGWALEETYQLLNERYRAERETIICTNALPTAIPSRVSSRLLDARLSSVVLLDVPDWRSGRAR